MKAQSGQNVFGQKVKFPLPPLDAPKAKRFWPHAESCYTLAKGGDRFGIQFKKRALGFVRIVTDDAEITLGIVVRDDEDNQVRVAHRVSVPRNPLDPESKRYHEWRLDAVCRSRILERVALN